MASVWSTRLICLNSLGSSLDMRTVLLCFVLFGASASVTFSLLCRKQRTGERANFGKEGVGTVALARTGAWDNSCVASSWDSEAGAQLAFSFLLFIQSRTPTLAVMLPMFRGVFFFPRGTGVGRWGGGVSHVITSQVTGGKQPQHISSQPFKALSSCRRLQSRWSIGPPLVQLYFKTRQQQLSWNWRNVMWECSWSITSLEGFLINSAFVDPVSPHQAKS